MKFFRSSIAKVCFVILFVAVLALAGFAAMPSWMQNIEVRSLLESAIFRTVPLPGGPVTIRRPPAETVPALTELIKTQPHPDELYSLRAMEEEQKLDFTSAEADWKQYLQLSPDKAAAELALADFYHRRHRPLDEIAALSALGRLPDSPSEKRTTVTDQAAWQAFDRSLKVVQAQALGKGVATQQYQAWMARYPEAADIYALYFEYLVANREFKAAEELVSNYRGKFPKDEIFPIRAEALLAYKQGSVEKAVGIYDKSFQPLWPKELITNYFELLTTTHSLGQFLERAHADLAQNPDDLNAVCRIFFYYEQKGNIEAAQQAVTEYRLRKESRKAAWTSQELYTLAVLLQEAKLYPEAARYYFALYNSKEADQEHDAQEKALAGLTGILLDAPEQQMRFGAADLSMYSDIATMDSGPGYLNGILSLILNSDSPDTQYAEEEQRAIPYFHRARAAQLIALLDQRFPNSTARSSLHARLIESYSHYGAQDAVIRLGREFLAAFPQADEREQVALLMADAYAAKENPTEEFAMYDFLLQELARKAEGVPLGENVAGLAPERRLAVRQPSRAMRRENGQRREDGEMGNDDGEAASGDNSNKAANGESGSQSKAAALSVHTVEEVPVTGPRSSQYANVLDRYLSRLALQHAVPQALAVLRQELNRNPNDPGLYEKLAQFLEQNELGTEQDAIYRRAMQQFPSKSWYHKLARWYVRKKRDKDLESLIAEVSRIFSGTELEDYFRNVSMPSDFNVQLNLYAHARFPHNLTFVRNLLADHALHNRDAAWEALARQHWFEDATLRNQFFEYLSCKGKLEVELAQLKLNERRGPGEWASIARANPATARFTAEAELWRSHFEEGAPALGAVAELYPAEISLGREASSVYRSLAYFNPGNTAKAAQIELNLLAANPRSRDTLARIGDIYSDREQFRKAAPYWNLMPDTEPGNPQSYEEAATVFWDYYFFNDALRLLNQGRTKLANSKLYSYEMGAIYEAERDYPRAVEEYVKGAVHEGENSSSHKRLLQLATRNSTKSLVDKATQRVVAQNLPGLKAIRLRVDVLKAQSKEEQTTAFLNAVLDRTTSVDVTEGIEHIAREKSLSAVRQHSLEREVTLSRDPMRRLQLRYELAHFHEDNKDLVAAARDIDSLYRENPRIMGVVRATVDFYWRNKKQQQAIDVLMQAAQDSHPELATRFTYEAARKMTDARQYQAARRLLLALLQKSPYDNDYSGAIAVTYLQSGDNAGLRDFYLQRIAFFRTASIPPEERKTEIASFRRVLIPELTALKDYAGAVDQYIEIVNAYPDDENFSSEAALYALRHGRKDQLVNFYRKTAAASPKDSRWIVVLARLQTTCEDYEPAIQTFSQAIKIRPDRADLLSARATLEERLMRFDEAASDYATLYERTYHDSRWMEKVAEIRARQSRPEPAVQALRTALVEGRPESPTKYFAVAERLERWGMLSQAREFAERGITVAGNDLLAASENHSGAELYVRIMTRMRLQETAWWTLDAAMNAARQLPPLQAQLEKKGLEAITDKEWRQHLLQTRRQVAQAGMAKCMRSMGSTIGLYFTPEEKQAFLAFAENKDAVLSREDAYGYLVPLAREAGFAGFQANLMYESLRTQEFGHIGFNEFIELQGRRLKLAELGQQLEEIARRQEPGNRVSYLGQAADTYHLAGQPLDELRVLKPLDNRSEFSPQQRERFYKLLLKHEPDELLYRARNNNQTGNDSANFILAHADMKMARAAINARSKAEDPVWRSAYTGLAGLYFKDTDPGIRAAFLQSLSDESIGQRVKHRGDRSEEMAGDVWFYYGSRYGEYLGITRKGDPEDWLPAQLEHAPAQSDAYFNSALYYEEIGDLAHAIEDYHHTLELSPKRTDAHDRLAGIYWKQGHRDAALSEWGKALEALKGHLSHSSYDLSQSFWDDYSHISQHLRTYGLLAQFRSELKELLRSYVKQSGSYRLLPILRGSLSNPNDPKEGTALVLELSHDDGDQLNFLGSFVQSHAGVQLQMEPLYRRILALAQENLKRGTGYEREEAHRRLLEWQMNWLGFLLESKQYDLLRNEMASVVRAMSEDNKEKEEKQDRQNDLIGIQIQLAAATNSLDSLLESFYGSKNPPSYEALKETARTLQQAGDRQAARKILEFVFRREVEDHNLNSANMLALAEIRIEAGELQSAVALLRRMTLVAGAPFETQGPAADLLMRTGHPQEAIGFLKELVNAVPWSAEYRVRLAQAQIAANVEAVAARRVLASVAADKAAPYEMRVSGAKSLSATDATADFGSRELKLLASGKTLTVDEANQPFFLEARLKAAEKLAPAKRVQLLRAALEDYPQGDSLRPALLRAAMHAGDYHLAIASIKPLVKSHWLEVNQAASDYQYYQQPEDDEADADADADSDNDADALQLEMEGGDEVPAALGKLPAEQKAEVAREIGIAFEKLGELPEALGHLKQASGMETTAAVKKQIDQEVRRIRRILEQRKENSSRQPEIHDALEQNKIVRPRLTTARPIPQKAAMQGVHP